VRTSAVRRDAFSVRLGEQRLQGIADPREPSLELRLVPALVLEADELDDPAGADDVVRRVEDAALVKALGVPGLRELVVRAAGDRAAGEARDRVGVERAADGAW
jgi:hypothetical protein